MNAGFTVILTLTIPKHSMLNDYKSKYKSVKAEFEKEYGPLTLNGYNSDEWLKDPWPWDIVE